MKVKKTTLKTIGVLSLVIAMLAIAVYADTKSTTVQFVIPSSVSHTISFGTVGGNACGGGDGNGGTTDFWFVEDDATIDGTQTRINASATSAGSTYCQNTTTAGMTITNAGTVAINVTASVAALDAGVALKTSMNFSGYEATCSDTATNTTCVNLSSTQKRIATNIATPGGTQKIWWWADFASYNAGVATTGSQRTVTTNATQA